MSSVITYLPRDMGETLDTLPNPRTVPVLDIS